MVKVDHQHGELTQTIWVKGNYSDRQIPAGAVVEILDQYLDEGYWSDGDPYHVENPYPAYVIQYDGTQYDSVHVKVIKVVD